MNHRQNFQWTKRCSAAFDEVSVSVVNFFVKKLTDNSLGVGKVTEGTVNYRKDKSVDEPEMREGHQITHTHNE